VVRATRVAQAQRAATVPPRHRLNIWPVAVIQLVSQQAAVMAGQQATVTRTQPEATVYRLVDSTVGPVVLLVELVAVLAEQGQQTASMTDSVLPARHRAVVVVAVRHSARLTTVAVVVLVQRVESCSRILHLLAATGDGEYS